MAKVSVNFQSDDKEVVAAIEKMNRKIAELQAKTQAASERAETGFNSMLSALGKTAIGYLSVNTAIQAGNQLLQDRIALQEKVRDKQLEAAAAEREFQLNQGSVSAQQRQRTERQIQEISRQRGVSASDVRSVAGSAMSSAGGNFDAAMQASSMALALQPYDNATAAELAGASLRLSNARGKMDPAQGFRSLIEIGASSNIRDWRQMAQYAPRGVGAAVNNQFSADAAEAMFIAMTKAGDTEGSNTATAMATFSARLRDFLPEEDTYTTNVATGKRTLKAKGTGLQTGDARLQYLRENAAERTRFLSSLEASADKPVIEQLLTAGTAVSTAFDAQLRKARTGGLIGAEEFATQMQDTDLQRTAELNRRLQRPSEEVNARNVTGSRTAIIRSQLDAMYESQGIGTMGRYARGMSFNFGSMLRGAEEQGIYELQERLPSIRASVSGAFGQDKEMAQRQYQATLEMIEVLKQARSDPKNTTTMLEKQLQQINRNQRAGNANQHVEGR